MAVPYIFATATTSIPLSQLDSNFATPITLGNTSVYLGNTTTSVGNLTLTNATISSVATTFPNSFLANSSITIGTTNVSLGGTASTLANVTLSNVTVSSGNVTTSSITDSGLTSGRVTYAGTGGLLQDAAALTFDGTILSATRFAGALNGTVGATTPSTGAFTSLSYSTTLTGGTGIVNLGSGQFYKDASGNVGIGTSAPSGKLDVNGGINLGASYINLASPNGASGDWVGGYNINWSTGVKNVATGAANGIYESNAGYIGFHTNTSQAAGTAVPERMRIDSSGNVGIGTSAGNARFNVYGQSGYGIARFATSDYVDGVSGSGILITTGATTGNTYTAINAFSQGYATTGNLILGSGNVGIGTTAPSMRLHVNGGTNTTSGVLLQNQATNIGIFSNEATWLGTGTSNNLAIASFGSASLLLGTSATERMRIDTSGNVGIGTSSPSASALLDVQSTTKGVCMPNMTTTQKTAISSPAAGLMVFDTTLAKLCVYSGSAWQTITSV